MKRSAIFWGYLFALTADCMRSLGYSTIVMKNPVSIETCISAALVCLSSILWFTLMLDEKEPQSRLTFIIMLKLLCITGGLIFLFMTVSLNFNIADLAIEIFYSIIFLVIDILLLFIAAVRGKQLCG